MLDLIDGKIDCVISYGHGEVIESILVGADVCAVSRHGPARRREPDIRILGARELLLGERGSDRRKQGTGSRDEFAPDSYHRQ